MLWLTKCHTQNHSLRYLGKKLLNGDFNQYGELQCVQVQIDNWYQRESEKILLQSRSDEISISEKVRIYHHDLHKKHIKRSAILKLQTEDGLLEGHTECANFLESQVGDLLLHPIEIGYNHIFGCCTFYGQNWELVFETNILVIKCQILILPMNCFVQKCHMYLHNSTG